MWIVEEVRGLGWLGVGSGVVLSIMEIKLAAQYWIT